MERPLLTIKNLSAWYNSKKMVLSDFSLGRCHSRKRFIKILMGKGFTRNQAAEIAEAVTWPHRYNLPRKYRPTYQGYLLNFMLDSALFAAVTIRKG